jgi:hypothetical protein
LLRKFYSLSKKLFSVVIKITFWVLKSIFVYLYKFFFAIYHLSPVFLGPVYPLLCNLLVYLIDFFLFFFVSIPRFFYCEFFKPFLLSFFGLVISFVANYNLLIGSFRWLSFYFFFLYQNILNILYKTYLRFYKLTIDFLYFDVYRNRHKIFNFVHTLLINFVRFFLVYFFFYINIWGQLHNW